MSLDQEATDWIAERTHELVAASMDGRNEDMAECIHSVGRRHGNLGVWSLCNGLAEAIAMLGGFERKAGAWHGFACFDKVTGQRVDVSDVDPKGAGVVLGMQFLTAYLNGDTDHQLGLYTAQPVKVTCGLAKLAGQYGNARRVDA